MSAESIPSYLAGANSDPLMTIMAFTLVGLILIGGVLYFKLHAAPEHIAHGKNHTQIQLITVLTLLALFTHNSIFWVAALVMAVVELPDFLTPLKSIAKSLATIANNQNKTAYSTEPEFTSSTPAQSTSINKVTTTVEESAVNEQTLNVKVDTKSDTKANTAVDVPVKEYN
ncbi:hypothetical protein [Colwellia echini]|uniref:hypothetical protein n=1 Tax=Colwellia echini TaxID=1982103 RepID=UPI001FE2F213|nr:hypothetical protein [Colwellia echini]